MFFPLTSSTGEGHTHPNLEILNKIKVNPLTGALYYDAGTVLQGVAALLSTRKVNPSYPGPCLRVRRDSDSAEIDVGFSNNQLDISALNTFLGSALGYIRTWYDQSQQLNHASQSNTSKQPRIIASAINNKPAIRFNGSSDYLKINNHSTLNFGLGDFAVFAVLRTTTVGSYPAIISKEQGYVTYGFNVVIEPGSNKLRSLIHDGNGAITYSSSPNLATGQGVSILVQWDRDSNTLGYVSNNLVGVASISSLNSIVLSNAYPVCIGIQGNEFNSPFNGDLGELILYNKVMTDLERTQLYNEAASFFSL